MLPLDLSPYILKDFQMLSGKRVLVRVDLNLPHTGDTITDTTRLESLIPYLKQLTFAGAKIILLSHFGEEKESIKPVADLLMQKLSGVSFIESTDIAVIRKAVDEATAGEIILIQNTRLFHGEEENVTSCAEAFASLGDVFINEAFSVSHREHASVVGIPRFLLSYLGPHHVKEILHLRKAITPQKPALLIVGGAKIRTKLPLIQHYLDLGVVVFVGGAMAHTILRQKGYTIGKSFDDTTCTVPESVYNHPLLVIPHDVVLSTGTEIDIEKMGADDIIVDCGKKTLAKLETTIQEAQTVIINGPIGLYEKGWRHATEQILSTTANLPHAHTYIGGGDTLEVASGAHLLHKFEFVSLGGGAMLAFLASGTLPGIDAVTKSHLAG